MARPVKTVTHPHLYRFWVARKASALLQRGQVSTGLSRDAGKGSCGFVRTPVSGIVRPMSEAPRSKVLDAPSAAMGDSASATSPATRQAAYAAAPTPGKWTRFACMMYEAILLFGVVFVADYLFDTLTQSKHALALRHERQAWLFVAIGAYFILCWRMGGQTLPMKTWDIRLVDGNGGRIPMWKAIVRYVLSWPVTFTGIGYVWACFDKDRQFLHDRLVGTRLIVSKAVKRPRKK